MAGAVVIVVVLLAFPVLFLMSMAIAAAIVGTTAERSVASRFEGSELLELNI